MFVSSGIGALDLRAMATNDGASGVQGAKVTEISPYFHPPPVMAEPYRYQHHQPSPPPAPTVPDPQQQHHYHHGEWYSKSQGYYQPSPPPHTHFNESQTNSLIYGPPPPSTYSAQPYPQPHTSFSQPQPNPIYGPPPLPWQTSYPSHQYSQNLDSGPLPTPASYYAPPPQPDLYPPPQHNLHTTNINGHSLTHQFPHVSQIPSPHRLPSNQNQWVPLPQAAHVILSPSSPPPQRNPYPLPPQPNHTEFCQLSSGPSCSPPFSAVPEHKEVLHSGPASALLDEHEKHSQPFSVAVTDKLTLSSPNLHHDNVVVTAVSPPLFLWVAIAEEAKLTSTKCESDEADVPNGTTTSVALGSAPQLDHELVSPRATTPKMLKTTIHHLIQTQRQSMSTAAHSNRTRLVGASKPTKYDPISAGADELDVPLGPPPALSPVAAVTKKQDFSALAKETSKGRALALDWLGDDSGGFPTMKIAINCFPPGLVLKDFELLVAADHMLKDHGKSATVSRCIQLLFDEVIFLNSSLKAPMRCPRLVESFVTVAVSMLEISKPARIPKTIDSVHQFILGHFGVSNLMATYEVANLHASLPYWRVARLHSATSSHKEYFEYDLHIDNLMASRRVNAQNLFVHMQIATPALHYSGFTLPLLNVDIVTVVPSIIHAWEFHFAHLGPPLPKSDIAYIDHDIAICEHLTGFHQFHIT